MKLLLTSVSLALVVGFLLGGRLTNLGRIRLRWPGLAIAALPLQLVSGPGSAIPLACLYLSFGLLVAFAIRNLRVTGFRLILAGIALNFLVIGVNRGMPVGEVALEASGGARAPVTSNVPKHHAQRPGDVGVFLGDVLVLPHPIGLAVSVGDIFTFAGIGVVVGAGMLAVRDPMVTERART
jgi:hypothetical protein